MLQTGSIVYWIKAQFFTAFFSLSTICLVNLTQAASSCHTLWESSRSPRIHEISADEWQHQFASIKAGTISVIEPSGSERGIRIQNGHQSQFPVHPFLKKIASRETDSPNAISQVFTVGSPQVLANDLLILLKSGEGFLLRSNPFSRFNDTRNPFVTVPIYQIPGKQEIACLIGGMIEFYEIPQKPPQDPKFPPTMTQTRQIELPGPVVRLGQRVDPSARPIFTEDKLIYPHQTGFFVVDLKSNTVKTKSLGIDAIITRPDQTIDLGIQYVHEFFNQWVLVTNEGRIRVVSRIEILEGEVPFFSFLNTATHFEELSTPLPPGARVVVMENRHPTIFDIVYEHAETPTSPVQLYRKSFRFEGDQLVPMPRDSQ